MFLMVAMPGSPAFDTVKAQLAALQSQLPEWMHSVPMPHVAASSREDAHPAVRFWWPAAFASGVMPLGLTPGLLIFDDNSNDGDGIEEGVQHQRWRRWLALFNTMQTLPGFLITTRQGIAAGDCALLEPTVLSSPSGNHQGSAFAAAWVDALEMAVAIVKDGLLLLAKDHFDVPEVGYEHVDQRGQVVAEAELAWPGKKLVVVLDAQHEYDAVWAGAGWTSISVQDDWVLAVRAHLMRQ
jgi:DEAD/DEAH box helicase domain-containing protein